MNGPYREGPGFLICPRCGEVLDRAFDDVLACLRCKGIFISQPTAGLAFGDPGWPQDTSAMWWKSSLECPVCARSGSATVMAAQSFEGTQIDRCAEHGLWLDAGELSRLARTTGDELAVLRFKLHGDGGVGTELDTKREELKRHVDARRKAAEDRDAWQASERARQIEAADRRHQLEKSTAEEERRIAAAWSAKRAPSTALFDPSPQPVAPPTPIPAVERQAEPPMPAPAKPPKPAPAKPPGEAEQPRPYAPSLTSREQLEREIWLGERRTAIVASIGMLEDELIEARTKVREIEGKLAAERARLRMLLEYGR